MCVMCSSWGYFLVTLGIEWEGFDLCVCRSKALIKAGKLGCNDCWGYFSCLHHFGVTVGAALNVKNVFCCNM